MSQTEVIKPASSRGEFLSVTGACTLIILTAAILVAGRTRATDDQELRDYQISAYADLSRIEQGTYNDLLTAAVEIDAIHFETQQWPTVAELDTLYLPPFMQDIAWKKRGALKWRRVIPDVEARHTVVYLGKTGDPQVSCSFMLWMSHNHGLNSPAMLGKAAPAAPLGGGVTPTLTTGLRAPGTTATATPGSGIGVGIGATPDNNAPGILPAGTPLPKPNIRVWRHSDGDVATPLVYQDQQLVAEGWQEVIAYKGENERDRLKGPEQAGS